LADSKVIPCSGLPLDIDQLISQRQLRSSIYHLLCIIMEASSPLAAMQATSFMPTWGRDMYTSHPHAHLAPGNGFGPSSFNFRDLSMKRSSKPDYFQMQPVRGSSPTASLAADLSQNFHIDMRYGRFNPTLQTSLTSLQPATTNTSSVPIHIEPFWHN